MFTYLITYDLSKPKKEDYERISTYIKNAYSYWAKPQQSVWLVKTTFAIDEVRTNVRKNLDLDDKLLVIDVTGANWATYNQSTKITDWMQKNV